MEVRFRGCAGQVAGGESEKRVRKANINEQIEKLSKTRSRCECDGDGGAVGELGYLPAVSAIIFVCGVVLTQCESMVLMYREVASRRPQ